jgi:organic hydroperoxide reductase OsmC/OhrA
LWRILHRADGAHHFGLRREMSAHRATVEWTLGDGDFAKGRYSRLHTIGFEGGVSIPGSASSAIVPAPWSSDEAVDPEAAFTAALSACHMLTFLDLARRAGFTISGYRDAAEGTLARVARGKMAVTRVVLRPEITWTGDKRPSAQDLETLHHEAHELCFIANSVTTEVVVEAPV